MEMNKIERESGVELLKIVAIFIIVLAHMTQCLSRSDAYAFFIDLNQASMNPTLLVLNFFRPLGAFGNDLFFICSAWFLCDKKNIHRKKIAYLEADIWLISVVILVVFLFMGTYHITYMDIMNSVFPTLTNSYWYTTCYMMIFLLSPWINLILQKASEKELFSITLLLSIGYFLMQTFADFLGISLFFSNRFIEFVALYLIIAYLKLYRLDFTNNRKLNIIMLLIGMLGWFAFVLCLNFAGKKINFLSSFNIWDKNHNVFLVIIAFSLFCLFKGMKFKNFFINYLSSLSLLIYLIHGNVLVIKYLLPDCWSLIFELYGHRFDILWSIILAVGFFVVSILVGGVYKKFLQPYVYRLIDTIFDRRVPQERN